MTKLQGTLRISNASIATLAGVVFIGAMTGTYLGTIGHKAASSQYPLGASGRVAVLSQPGSQMKVKGSIDPAAVVKEMAADAAGENQKSMGGFISKLSHGALQLISEAPGPAGMTAVNLIPTGQSAAQRIIGWVLPGQGGLVLGPLFDPNGVNENLAYEQKLGIAENVSPGGTVPPQQPLPLTKGASLSPAQVRDAIAHAGFSGFTEGKGPVHLSVFFDANCSVCHDLWLELQQDQGWGRKFTINWIPVGAVKPTWGALGAALLAGGVNALDFNESRFDSAGENGGIKGSTDPKLLQAVQDNTNRWASLVVKDGQQPGTPTFVIDDRQISVGLPSPAEMTALTGAEFP